MRVNAASDNSSSSENCSWSCRNRFGKIRLPKEQRQKAWKENTDRIRVAYSMDYWEERWNTWELVTNVDGWEKSSVFARTMKQNNLNKTGFDQHQVSNCKHELWIGRYQRSSENTSHPEGFLQGCQKAAQRKAPLEVKLQATMGTDAGNTCVS